MLTEHRILTAEERKELEPVLEKLPVQNAQDILRFVDTKLDKRYDVYLIKVQNETRVLKQVGVHHVDKVKYDAYFAGKDFAVPEVFDCVSADGKDYVLIQFVEGVDARDCDTTQATHIGTELGRIQGFYLTDGGHTEAAEKYWEYFDSYYEKLKKFFIDIDDVWECIKQRFFEVPHTLVHEDLLPINVLIEKDRSWIIDWEMSGIYPYFLDLARFTYIFYNTVGKFFISKESAEAFLEAYYKEMKKNPYFDIDKKQFLYDVAISAFCQYISIQDYDKSLEEIEDSADFKFLKEIICYFSNHNNHFID